MLVVVSGSLLSYLGAVLVAEPDCLPETKTAVHEYVTKSRYQQEYQTIPLELFCDNQLVNHIISGKAFFVAFASDGTLYHSNSNQNIFTQSLSEVLQQTYPFYTSS